MRNIEQKMILKAALVFIDAKQIQNHVDHQVYFSACMVCLWPSVSVYQCPCWILALFWVQFIVYIVPEFIVALKMHYIA